MKYFTHPTGIFEIKVPLDWHYKNQAYGYEDKSPYSFEIFENVETCFQLSCYHKSEKSIKPNIPIHDYNTTNLKFVQSEISDHEMKAIVWFTVVDEYTFMAKLVFEYKKISKTELETQIDKVNECLSTLMCLSPDRREYAVGYDRFEKFNASLGASHDLKYKALNNRSYIELIVINANLIDAYLRLCIVLKFQIIEKTNLFRLKYLFQSSKDKPVFEKKIYQEAKDMKLISTEHYDKLFTLYNLRNKVVHRYLITDLKTNELMEIAYQYELACEETRLILANIETEQFENKVGYHGSKDPHAEKDEEHINQLFSMVNDKHFYKEFYREIK